MKAACFALIGLCLSANAYAATRTAASCSRTDVASAVNSASDGDTIVIPAGTCTWTANLTITGKILVLQGAGIDRTVIIDGVSKDGYPNVPQMFIYNTKPGGLTRITGMTFTGGAITDPYNKGMVEISGNSDQFRMDNVKIHTTQTAGLMFHGNVRGIVDHSVFRLTNWKFGIYVFHETWNNSGDFGDASYADDSHFGTNKAIFIEDNVFESADPAVAIDGWSGSRVVFRYNRLRNAIFANHGTESPGRWRSQRVFEVYGNTFTNDSLQYPQLIGIRGGTGVVFNNTATTTGNGFANHVTDLSNFRSNSSFPPWGQCDGSNKWDGNQGSAGYPCLDQPGRGRGSLLSGVDPTPAAWVTAILDPIYAWNNTLNGQVSPMLSNTAVIVEGRDFFNAPKPNYTPYTYPHPLVSGQSTTAPTGPTPPPNVRIVS